MQLLALRSVRALVTPALIFVALASMTLFVWRLQEQHAEALRLRHAEDIATQASRRLQIFLDAQLRLTRLFGRRWAGHETGDFSARRFTEFAGLMFAELEGLERLALFDSDGRLGWVEARVGRPVAQLPLDATVRAEVAGKTKAWLLGPVRSPSGEPELDAVLFLQREGAPAGYLRATFATRALIGACFEHRIRDEFDFLIRDREIVLFHSTTPGALGAPPAARMVSVDFEVRNRRWQMAIAPRVVTPAAEGWAQRLPVGFGLLLSFGLSYLVYLLARRMDLYRRAHAAALAETDERRRAQEAQQASEARYREVFATVTDGLLLVDGGGRIVDANPAAGRMHGCEPEALAGRPVVELLSAATRSAYDDLRRELAAGGHGRAAAQAVRADGETFAVELGAVRLFPGGVADALLIVTDVNERQLVLSQLSALSRKVLVAQEEERARLARDLHDELGQVLTALRLEIDWLSQRGSASPTFDNLVGLVRTATDELRRLCRGLRPPLLDDLGLEPALRLLVDEFRERSGIAVEAELSLAEGAVPVEAALSAYRIVQEALTNVARHAAAKNVRVEARLDHGELRAEIADDGRGFVVSKVDGAGVGLAGMRERASLAGGLMTIDAQPGGGTRVRFRIPVPEQRSRR